MTSHWRERFALSAGQVLPGERWERRVFWSLMFLAAVLRFWDLPSIPYTHDELSALLRLFPTLGETIRKGVMEGDTHPPGVQVFEWFWTRAFGTSEAAVKFPFIVMGLAALFFWYRVACAWTSTAAALIVIALLATLQYSVMYAQIARPYAFGFFTCALLLDQLTRYVATGRTGALAGFALAAALSAYTHHFALLFAALVVVSGFALLRKEQRLAYALACGVAALLYLPNLPILLHQFSQGGLSEWLAAPGPYWLRDYAAWITMYSWPLALVLFGLAAWSVVASFRARLWKEPLPWLMLFWGLAPIAIGYGYSVWRAPVLQYSMLIFSFPCLLFAALHGLPRLSMRLLISLVSLAALLGLHGLIMERGHYSLLYSSKYEAFVEAAQRSTSDDLVIIDAQQGILEFYQRRAPHQRSQPYVLRSTLAHVHELHRLLGSTNARVVVLGITPATPPELPAIVQEYFPELTDVTHFSEGSLMRFSKDASSGGTLQLRTLPLNGWSDSTAVEFSGIVEADVADMITGKNDVIDVRASVRALPNDDIALVTELNCDGKSVLYRSTPLMDGGPWHNGEVILHVAIPISNFELRGRRLHFKGYVYNRTGRWLGAPEVTVRVWPGNPIIYGLYEPIGGL